METKKQRRRRPAPYGLRGVEDELRIVTSIRQRFAQDLSLSQIADRLNQMGVPSPDGDEWDYNKVRRIARGPAYDAVFGRIPSKKNRTGPPPYGLRGDPKETEVIRRIFREAAIGAGKATGYKSISVRRIAERLNADGIPSARGGAWAPAEVSYIIRSDRYKDLASPIMVNRARQAMRARRKRRY